jgi:RHS repeat-associated protein
LFGFDGELQSPSSGLIQLRARWYQPATGRMLGRDPLAGVGSDPLSQQPYLFARDNPLRYADPSGRSAINLVRGLDWLSQHASQLSFDPSDLRAGTFADIELPATGPCALAEQLCPKPPLPPCTPGGTQLQGQAPCEPQPPIVLPCSWHVTTDSQPCDPTPQPLPPTNVPTPGNDTTPIGGTEQPRFVVAPDGKTIDTASPDLKRQVEEVVESIRSTGAPPKGVRQGGLPGKLGVFENRGNPLPVQPVGYYTESDVWPGTGPRGSERVVVGRNGEAWYTPDHYGTFRPLP